jgi:phosphatidylserine synthase
MNTPQRQHIGLPALAAMVAMVAVFLIPAWIPALRTAPWEWIVVAIQAILTVALVVYLVRFVRKQRDDYWRERGKDPRHPEA